MGKKVLFVATVVKGHIDVFHIPYLKMFKEMGWETEVYAKNNYDDKSECIIPYCDKFYDAPFTRNPLSIDNLKSYKFLKKLIDENDYDIIHCHTPVGGVITRLAFKNSLNYNKTKLYYTAHGLHFFKDAPLKNWLMYYPIEKYLSKYTDTLIVMNKEDYDLSKKRFHTPNVKLVNGVGVDFSKFSSRDPHSEMTVREELNIKPNDFTIIYVGELSNRKNQQYLLKSIPKLSEQIENLKVLIVGEGENYNFLKRMAEKLEVSENVLFLGYRKDINVLIGISDIVVSTSKQEGLPVNIMEGMSMGKPIVLTDCRGNRDLIVSGENGYVVSNSNINEFINKILYLYKNEEQRVIFGENNKCLSKSYEIDVIIEDMKKIYFN